MLPLLLPAITAAAPSLPGLNGIPGIGSPAAKAQPSTSSQSAIRDTMSSAARDAILASGAGNRGYTNNFSPYGAATTFTRISPWVWAGIAGAGILLFFVFRK